MRMYTTYLVSEFNTFILIASKFHRNLLKGPSCIEKSIFSVLPSDCPGRAWVSWVKTE